MILFYFSFGLLKCPIEIIKYVLKILWYDFTYNCKELGENSDKIIGHGEHDKNKEICKNK